MVSPQGFYWFVHYLFVRSLLCSGLRLSLTLFCYVTMLSTHSFHYFIICLLLHYSVLGFDCLFLCVLRHYALSSWFPLYHYLFVASLLCSRLSLLLFVTSLCFILMVSIV